MISADQQFRNIGTFNVKNVLELGACVLHECDRRVDVSSLGRSGDLQVGF